LVIAFSPSSLVKDIRLFRMQQANNEIRLQRTYDVTMPALLTLGIAVLDEVFSLPGALVAGEKHRAGSLATVIGGTATNAARAIARLGGSVGLITRLGEDGAADVVRSTLEQEGIDLSLSRNISGCKTSRSAILIEANGNRTIANFLDPTLPDRPDWLITTLPVGTKAVLADVRWEAGSAHLFRLARASGIPAVLDGDRAPQNADLLDLATHVVFSSQGLAEITGMTDCAASLAAFAAQHPGFYSLTNKVPCGITPPSP
jgi:sulfofructose kinase